MPESKANRSSRNLIPAAVFVVLAHTVDVASTVYSSPDLMGEWNVLHRHFELGIPGLLAAKALWAIAAIVGYDFYLRHRTACYPTANERHLGFYRYFALGPPIARRASDRKIARLRLGVHIGFLLVSLHWLAVWAAFDNLLLAAGSSSMLHILSENGYHAIQAVIVTSLALARFYAINYQRYCLLRASDALPGRS